MKNLGYRPRVDGPVVAGVDTPAVKTEAMAGAASYSATSEGAIVVTLRVKPGARLGGDGSAATRVVVTGGDAVTVPEAEVSLTEALTGARELRIPVRIAEGARKGEHSVTVRVTFQSRKGDAGQAEQTVELRVPVVVQ